MLFAFFLAVFTYAEMSPSGKWVSIEEGTCADAGLADITQGRDCERATDALGFTGSYSKQMQTTKWTPGCIYSSKTAAAYVMKEKMSSADRAWIAGGKQGERPARREAGEHSEAMYTYFCEDLDVTTKAPEDVEEAPEDAEEAPEDVEEGISGEYVDPGCAAVTTGCRACMDFGSGYDCVFDKDNGVCLFGADLGEESMTNTALVWVPFSCDSEAEALFMTSMSSEDAMVYLFAIIGLGAIGHFGYKEYQKRTAPTASIATSGPKYDTVTEEL